MRSGSDPISEDLAELDTRADEDEREARWDAFVLWVKAQYHPYGRWNTVIFSVGRCLEAPARSDDAWAEGERWFREPIMNFAATEGWHGVLSAIARAMREQAKANS